jgi:hypothetical protein
MDAAGDFFSAEAGSAKRESIMTLAIVELSVNFTWFLQLFFQ